MKEIIVVFMMLFTMGSVGAQIEDPYIWLEAVEDETALEWVKEQNRESLAILKGHPMYQKLFESNLEVLNSNDRIVAPSILGDYIYNFWQDANHVRGIWRRTAKESYLAGNPEWETLLDIDELSEQDDERWVFQGATGLYPHYDVFMVSLSRGGADASVIREFDVNSKSFIKDGFQLPEAKGGVSWLDRNTLLVNSDFGEGTLTTSGYARQVRRWERGTQVLDAPVIFEAEENDVITSGGVINKPDRQYAFVVRSIDFFSFEYFLLEDERLIKVDIPADARIVNILNGQLIVDLKSDWEKGGYAFRQGSLVSIDYDSVINGNYDIQLIVEPVDRSSIDSVSATENILLVSRLTNVVSELYKYTFEDGMWQGVRLDVPNMGALSIGSTDAASDNFFFYYQNFLTPSSLYYADANDNSYRLIQSTPSFFDSAGLEVWQYEARSADGTMVPYFVVGKETMVRDGRNPTLLTAYGGFEVSRRPFYSAITGQSWLAQGGVFVLANIRGGGEFGPNWHQAGLKENRQRVFDDFHAVAEDLIERGITSGRHLGIQGGSNGGLLVGVAFTQKPELYNAVVCQVPLLDMQRYNKLLAGASWMGEYGNPDIPEEWEYIRKYSPYHNLKNGQDYPVVFFTTSTRDDRVHPGHARKMVAKMKDMGYTVYYYENMEGGHAGASTNEQRAMSSALGYTYLYLKLFE
jgi:prolyl oligopeptidase